MQFRQRKRIAFLMAAILTAFSSLCSLSFRIRPAYALEAWPSDCYVASEGACLMDASSRVVLFEKNANEPYYPASITKVLTALVTIENCENLSEQVTFSYDAVHIEEENSTIIGASEGDRLSVLDCLYCLLFQSANEVANALAEHVGAKHPELKGDGENSRDVFVKMMNLKAEELGCRGSHFHNPSGLTDENHYTTAYDMCLIMAAAIKNETFLDIESHTYWTHAPIRRYPDANDPWNTVYAKHMMLRRNSAQYYPGTIAGKTGYTMNAGNTLVTACKKDDTVLVACVLNAHANHYNDTRRLFDFGYDHFSSLKLTDYDNTNDIIEQDFDIAGIPVIDSYTIGIDQDTRITIPKSGSFVEVKKTLNLTDVSTPGALAEMIYTYGDRRVGSAGLKLIPLGGNTNLEAAVGEDPLLGKLLGIEPADENGAAADGSGNTNTNANTGGAGSAAADGGVNSSQLSGSGGTASSSGDSAASSADGSSVSADPSEGRALRILMTAGKILTALALIGVSWLSVRTILDRREAARQAKRRARLEARTHDMTGTQRIEMDLKLQRRLRKNKGKRKR